MKKTIELFKYVYYIIRYNIDMFVYWCNDDIYPLFFIHEKWFGKPNKSNMLIKPIEEIKYALVGSNGNIIKLSIQDKPHYEEEGWGEFKEKGFTCHKIRVLIEPIDDLNNTK